MLCEENLEKGGSIISLVNNPPMCLRRLASEEASFGIYFSTENILPCGRDSRRTWIWTWLFLLMISWVYDSLSFIFFFFFNIPISRWWTENTVLLVSSQHCFNLWNLWKLPNRNPRQIPREDASHLKNRRRAMLGTSLLFWRLELVFIV